jgi:host factor-I protein
VCYGVANFIPNLDNFAPHRRGDAGSFMEDAIDSAVADRSPVDDEFASRKLIRPPLSRADHNHAPHNHSGQIAERAMRSEKEKNDRNTNGSAGGKKVTPPEQTNAENFYYQKQMQAKTAMVVVLEDGEEIRGVIEWYDKSCLKVNRTIGPNLLIYKPSIKYMYKESEK